MVIRLLFRRSKKEMDSERWAVTAGALPAPPTTEPAYPRSVRSASARRSASCAGNSGKRVVNSIIYLVGLVVVVLFILSFLGLH